MRTQRKNKRPFYYANFISTGLVQAVDEWGNPLFDEWGNPIHTGESENDYSDPIKMTANISPAKGEASIRQFGELDDYDKVIVFAGKSPLQESSILWIDNLHNGEIPEVDGKQIAHDYIVKRIAESLNSTSLAVKKVTVSAAAYAPPTPPQPNTWDDISTWNDSDIWNDWMVG